MTQTYFRVQSGADNPADLLVAENQLSRAWHEHHLDNAPTTRTGVSVCATREALAGYLATYGQGIPFGLPGWVLVELRGDISDDQPLDAEGGELLIHPTEIVNVGPIDAAFFDLIGDALDAMEA